MTLHPLIRGLLAVAAVLSLTLLSPFARAAATCPPVASPLAGDAASAPASRVNRGLLWRISKGGRSSYLYGTLHVGQRAWAQPGPALRQAFQSTQVLALELDLNDPEVAQVLSAPTPPEQTPQLSAALRQRLEAQATLACLPPAALAALHPVMQAMTYTVLSGRWDGLDPAYGSEQVLMTLAAQAGRKVLGLETAQSQRELLIPSDPQEALEQVEQALDQLEGKGLRAQLRRMSAAWARGDLAELARYEQWCDCIRSEADREALRRLNDGRNPGLAERIAAVHEGGQTVLAAVGSLHMTGPQALTRLLAAKGFKVERLH